MRLTGPPGRACPGPLDSMPWQRHRSARSWASAAPSLSSAWPSCMAMKRDKLFLPLLAAAILVALAITVLMYLWFSWFAIPLGIMLVLLAALIVLNLRINKVVMAEAEGQPGAAAAIIERMRGDFRVTPAVSLHHRQWTSCTWSSAGPAWSWSARATRGRVRSLIGHERKRLTKVIGSADLRDIIIGHGEGQVPLRKLRMTLLRCRAR